MNIAPRAVEIPGIIGIPGIEKRRKVGLDKYLSIAYNMDMAINTAKTDEREGDMTKQETIKSYAELLERATRGANAIPNAMYSDAVKQVIELARETVKRRTR